MAKSTMTTKPKRSVKEPPDAVDPHEAHVALRERIRAKPEFRAMVEGLLDSATVYESRLRDDDEPDDESVDEGIAKQCRAFVGPLAHVGLIGRGTPAEVAFVKSFIAERTRYMPVVSPLRGRAKMRIARRAEPWQIALARIFTIGAYGHLLEPFPKGRVGQETRAFPAVKGILIELGMHGIDLPKQFRDAIDHLGAADSIGGLPVETRTRVENAIRWLVSLTTRLPPPNEDRVQMRIGTAKLGGSGAGRKISHWKAAVEFAKQFTVRGMSQRVHDVARER